MPRTSILPVTAPRYLVYATDLRRVCWLIAQEHVWSFGFLCLSRIGWCQGGGSNMRVNDRGHQTFLVQWGESAVTHQTKNRGPCPVCDQCFPQLRLGPFIKHRQHCKAGISQREVNCLSPGLYTNSHLRIKKHPGPLCAEVSRTNSNLKAHLLIHTEEKPCECKQCGRKFVHKDSLTRHLRIDTTEHLHKCEHCHKSYFQESHLTRHQYIHTDSKPFVCRQYNQRFEQKSDLINHRWIHKVEKPHKCSECDKSFARKSSLRDHQLTHSGEKPYGCSLCHKRFVQKGALKRHMRIHTGEKPYQCGQCDKRFTQGNNLKVHQRTHTSESPYECNLCNKAFKYNKGLRLHMAKHQTKPLSSVGPAPVR